MTTNLFELEDFGLIVDPTEAMRSGEQKVSQCAWCGCVVVWGVLAGFPQLGACSACGRADWVRQQLPLAGIRRTTR
ncbi:MAG: hypothetical protein WC829_03270 [Hyphomicrobium sp.]|jgi:hypothetical protein